MTDFTGTDKELTDLLDYLYTCNRVWEAWQVGTMTEDDFAVAGQDEDVVADFTAWRDAAVAAETKRLRAQVEGLESRLTDAENMAERLTP